MAKAVSTKDISRILGLSRSTVTRALNDDPKIKKETAARIHALAKELGYQKNSIASSLVSGQTNIVGCTVPNLVDPFFGEMVSLINNGLIEAGMGMLLGINNDDDRVEEHLITTYLNYRVEGLLLHDTRTGYFNEHLIDLKRSQIPLVVLGDAEKIGVDSVMGNDEQGAYDLVSYLASCHYSRIAFIGDLGHVLMNKRLHGYRTALLENNLHYSPAYIADCGRLAEVKVAVHSLLELSEPPDAIFCQNDVQAIEAHHALSLMGRRVPDDIGLAGFDNIAIAGELSCPLTTVDLRLGDIVHTALEVLLERIEARRMKRELDREPRHLRIKPSLCIRATTRRVAVPAKAGV